MRGKKRGGKYGFYTFLRPSRNIQKTDGSQCRNCLYRAMGDSTRMMIQCEYILLTGNRRDCPPSPNCTKWKEFNDIERGELEKKFHVSEWKGGVRDD